MSAFALFAFLGGAVLAFRFKVTVLYPITGLGAVAAIALGLTAGAGIGAILLGIVACGVALQIGYLFGGLVRGTMIAARLARRRQTAPARRNTQTV
ncbi:MAG: hypothetical protein ACXWJW_03980 [Xanthobacteraceae bacterium]